MQEPVVHIDRLKLQFRSKAILDNLSWTIRRAEQWLITGESGTGKTVLAKAICGLIPVSGTVELKFDPCSNLPARSLYVAQWFPFKDKQGGTNFYYQQRYNSTEAENSATVWEELSAYARKVNVESEQINKILQSFNLLHRKDAALIQLSSGEHKKIQLSKALLLKPQLLILDNPYTGLDVQTRQNLNELLNDACTLGMQLILISNDGDLPSCINCFGKMERGKLSTSMQPFPEETRAVADLKIPDFLMDPQVPAPTIVDANNVNVSYNGKAVLKQLDWTVNTGEKWLLSGHNGSGKSTLLSLLTGDHPQAYANEIYLFGKKRGSGESIWDIKKNIGFISPELQWYFEPTSTVFQTIASGFFDTAGLFRSVTAAQADKVRKLLSLFKLEDEAHTLLKQLPLGKQRIVLLARAIIKNPPVLILDEPCQGLDQQQTKMFNRLVDQLSTPTRTLIYVGHLAYRLPACITHRLTLKAGVAVEMEHALHTEN